MEKEVIVFAEESGIGRFFLQPASTAKMSSKKSTFFNELCLGTEATDYLEKSRMLLLTATL